MAQFTVTLNAKTNGPPTAIGSNTINISDSSQTYIITSANLTTETTPPYTDQENDAASILKILSLPLASEGVLYINAIAATVNGTITFADIVANKLTFIPSVIIGQYITFFNFDIADVGSGLYSGLSTGQLNFNVSDVINAPPTVGDGSQTIDYAATLVFTRAMFTSLTTPIYSDPEGDPADLLKILTLPTDGVLQLNGIDIVINQIVNFTDIDAGNFIFVSGLDDTNGDIENFTFAIADTGSGIFVE